MQDKITLLTADARTYNYAGAGSFDLVIMEMLTVGMIEEHQVQAFNNLHSHNMLSATATTIPLFQETFVTPAYSDFRICGFDMVMPLHLWKGFHPPEIKPLSEPLFLDAVYFNKITPLNFSKNIVVTAQRDETLNSLLLTSRTYLTEAVSITDTLTLNGPVLIPIKEMFMRKGSSICIQIQYQYGGGYDNLKITIDPKGSDFNGGVL